MYVMSMNTVGANTTNTVKSTGTISKTTTRTTHTMFFYPLHEPNNHDAPFDECEP